MPIYAYRCLFFAIMETQRRRRQNLARILVELERLDCTTAEAQAQALGNAMTPHKLGRLLFGSYMSVLLARGIEHSLGLPRGWLDASRPPLAPLPVPPRLAVEPAVHAQSAGQGNTSEWFIQHPPLFARQ